VTTEQHPVVLVVDDDPGARRLVRLGLELEGATVVEAGSVAQARSALSPAVRGVVLDRELPDGDGLELVAAVGEVCPDARIVVNSTIADGREPAVVSKVDKGDLPEIVRHLDLVALEGGGRGDDHLVVVDLVRAEAGAVADEWVELCRWDPLLPPDSAPPDARQVVEAIADALTRPQPLGWGPDPALQKVTENLAVRVGHVDVVVGQLICLREALRRRLSGHVPPAEEAETRARIHMVIDRAIWTAARVAAGRLQRLALTDPLTGLGNRRAFEEDLARELAAVRRHGRELALVILDLDGLKAVNERNGHAAGDQALRALSAAMATSIREQDGAYRIGGDEFAVVLPDSGPDGVARLRAALREEGVPAAAVGAAVAPAEGIEVGPLMAVADERLLADKRGM
jgi:diguanylate cyclase (GGDEF)-like protein